MDRYNWIVVITYLVSVLDERGERNELRDQINDDRVGLTWNEMKAACLSRLQAATRVVDQLGYMACHHDRMGELPDAFPHEPVSVTYRWDNPEDESLITYTIEVQRKRQLPPGIHHDFEGALHLALAKDVVGLLAS